MKITVCPTCGSKKIKQVQRNWTGKTRGQAWRWSRASPPSPARLR